MLPIWKGFGWLAPVIFLAAFVDVQLLVDWAMGEGFYTANRWVQVFSLVAVAIVVAGLGLWMNLRDKLWQVDRKTGKKVTAPAHTFLYLPVEVWAVIVPCIFLGYDYFQQELEAQTLAYLETPKVNDVYAVDLSKIFENEDPIYKYGTLKVVAVVENQVEVRSSTHAYDGKRGVRKDLKNDSATQPDYYNSQITLMTIRELLGYYKNDVIYAVHRD
ncbi:hypothetical protein [Marinomonas sp. THO17]|uniref:hypothetical protein n=1 Tax=Marinomonas sp. THO17 TaxID=3149048 RepID=UPI00336BF604